MTRSFDASHIDSFASGVWPLWSWVLGDTRELYLRFGLTLGEFSCCQFLVGEMLSNYRNYERVQPLQGVTAHIADIQAKRELVHIAMQVLLGNLMVNAVHSALEHGPDGFNAVRADSVLAVLSGSVVDAIVTEEQDVKADISSRFVTENRRADFNVGMDGGLDRCRIGCVHRHLYSTSAALPDAQHSSLADAPTASPQFLVFMLVGFFPADVALIRFDNAPQFVEIIPRAARLSEPLQHKPCRLLSNADLLCQLQARDALPGRDKQVHRIEPLMQGNVAAFKDRPRADREIQGTGIAAVETNLRLFAHALTALAFGAEGTMGPEPRFQINAC